jgi:hypothetical protein
MCVTLVCLSHSSPLLLLPAGIIGDNQFTEGFVSGLLLIFFSEIGDKTFFIALLLALKQVRSKRGGGVKCFFAFGV